MTDPERELIVKAHLLLYAAIPLLIVKAPGVGDPVREAGAILGHLLDISRREPVVVPLRPDAEGAA